MNDPNMLKYILENFEKTEPMLLELLLYTQTLVKGEENRSMRALPGQRNLVSSDERNTALHVAYDMKNSRSVDIIL